MTGELITRGNLDTNRHREGRPSEDSGRRQPSISQVEKPQKKPILPTF